MKDNIILIGFMGCGKTSVGIKLSYQMRRTMVDTDKWIEKKQKMTVSDIFDTYGEEAFRRMETECLKELIQIVDGQIISVGGGLPVREENHRLLKQLGRVIYLKVTPETVYLRLKDDTSRPLLKVEDPLGRICSLMEKRGPVYEACADRIIEASELSFEEIISRIMAEV